MSQQLIERIRELDDFRSTRFFIYFSQKLFDETDISQEALQAQIPDEIRNRQELSPVFNLTADAKSKTLGADDAVVCARGVLEALAQHPGFEKALEQALDEYRDDDMIADIIMAVGLAASMIIVAATSHFQVEWVKGEKLKIKGGKDVAPTDMVTGVVDSLCGIAGKVLPLG